MTWGHIVVGVVSSALVLVGTVVAARWQAKVGHEANDNNLMDQQRRTFESMLAPLQTQVSDLRGRVDNLEKEVRAERDLRERIVSYARNILWAWQRQFPDHPPPAPPTSIASHFD